MEKKSQDLNEKVSRIPTHRFVKRFVFFIADKRYAYLPITLILSIVSEQSRIELKYEIGQKRVESAKKSIGWKVLPWVIPVNEARK